MVEANGVGTAFVRTPNPMELGDLFALKLYLNDGREPPMVQAKVIWTNQYGQDKKHLRRGMGVKFLKLQSEEQKRIGDYTQKQRAALEKPSETQKNPQGAMGFTGN
jgi:Tfp pilus assembly protein PilZ